MIVTTPDMTSLKAAVSGLSEALPRAFRAVPSSGNSPSESPSWDRLVSKVEQQRPDAVHIPVVGSLFLPRLATHDAVRLAVATDLTGRGLWAGTPRQYLSARRLAEAQDTAGSISDWYSADVLGSRVSASLIDLLNAEAECEAELLQLVPGAYEALTAIRNVVPITFVGRPPFDETTIVSLLSSHRLYSASLDTVIMDEVVEPVSRPIVAPDFSRLDRYGQVFAADWSGYGPALAAAGRTARLRAIREDNDEKLAGLSRLGSSAIGSTMVAFLLWIRQQCDASGINHLEFLARDGELPLRIARAMPQQWWDGRTMDYLHCGRRSWSLAAASLVGIEAWLQVGAGEEGSFLVHSSQTVPFRVLLERCGLSSEDLDQPVFRNRSVEEPLTSADAALWQDHLLSGALNDVIEQRSMGPRDLILRFLRERGVPSSTVGLVDVGWRGHQAWLVSSLVKEAIGHEPVHFHFGGDNVDPWLADKVDIRRFALDDSYDPHPFAEPVLCLEVFLSSGNPRLIGYELVGDKVVERFEAATAALDKEEKEAIAEGAIAVGSALPTPAQLENWGVRERPLRAPTREVLRLLWDQPLQSEAALLAPLAFEGDDRGESIATVAHQYQLDDTYGDFPMRRHWRQGSLAITPQPFRALFGPYIRRVERRHAATRGAEHREIRRKLQEQ